jgi:copper homeostasis protein
VLAGSGLTIDAVGDFVRATGVRAVHFGSGVRPRGEVLAPVDGQRVERVRAALDGTASHV